MIKIKFPKKLSEKKIEQFFIKEGLKELITKKKFYVDGYEVTKKDYKDKKIDKTDSQPEPVRTQALQQGYCFIGKINDTRHCAKVNERQQCMSGDIYPTMDICVNPNLRA